MLKWPIPDGIGHKRIYIFLQHCNYILYYCTYFTYYQYKIIVTNAQKFIVKNWV